MSNKWRGIISLLACAFLCTTVQAQQFEVSTEDNPKWFIIRVMGADETAGLVITENGNTVVGNPLTMGGFAELNKQLWRIEQGTGTAPANTYRIINRSSGKHLDIAYDAAKQKRIAVVSKTPTTEWRIVNNGLNLRATTEPSEGTAGHYYLMQTGRTENYALVFTTSSSITNANAKFEFWLPNTFPLVSDGKDTAWLRIQNAKTALAGKSLADVGDTAPNGPFKLVDAVANDHTQQWKIVLKGAPAESGRVDFINRATGRTIGTGTVYDRYYYLHAFSETEAHEGWRIQALSDGLYEIASGTLTGAWYWSGTTAGDPPRFHTGSSDTEQGFAWRFQVEELPSTGFQPVETPDVRIYPRDRFIYVEGADRYTITNLYGLRMPNNQPLPVGIYLVTVHNKTTKVIVK
jgi:hypothetical protein